MIALKVYSVPFRFLSSLSRSLHISFPFHDIHAFRVAVVVPAYVRWQFLGALSDFRILFQPFNISYEQSH